MRTLVVSSALAVAGVVLNCSNESSFNKMGGSDGTVVEDRLVTGALVNEYTKTEVFVVEKIDSPLDILLIVDDSGSMSTNGYSQNLRDNLNPLLGHIADSDWQIVIKTTSKQGCFRAQINKGDPDYKTKFENAIGEIISRGDGREEEAIQVATIALNEEGGFALSGDSNPTVCQEAKLKWLRDNSVVAILIVSDEDVDVTCDTSGDGTNGCIDTFYDRLVAIREPHVTAKVYGIP